MLFVKTDLCIEAKPNGGAILLDPVRVYVSIKVESRICSGWASVS
jgi:hypothetical protein